MHNIIKILIIPILIYIHPFWRLYFDNNKNNKINKKQKRFNLLNKINVVS